MLVVCVELLSQRKKLLSSWRGGGVVEKLSSAQLTSARGFVGNEG